MTTLSDNKISQQDSYYVVGLVEDYDDNHYLIDLFPCGAGPLLQINKQLVTVETSQSTVLCRTEDTKVLAKISIAKNAAVVVMQSIQLADHPLTMLLSPLPALSGIQSSKVVEESGAELFDFQCTVWKTNPLYWQVVAALQIAKATGVLHNEHDCKKVAASAEALALELGLPPAFTELVAGSLAKCACKHVF